MLFGIDVLSLWRFAIVNGGEDVAFQPIETGVPGAPFRASVQSPGEAGLVGTFDQETFVVFIVPDMLPRVPKQFDRLVIRGKARAVQEVHREGAAPPDFLFKLVCWG
jgi:hypothetical protein